MSENFAGVGATGEDASPRIASRDGIAFGRPVVDDRLTEASLLVNTARRPVLEAPFAPLMDMAGIVALANPQLAAFTARIGLALRAGAEEELRRAIPALRRVLSASGFLDDVVDRVCDDLLTRHLPVPPDELLDDAVASYAENVEAGWILADAPASSFLCGLIADFELGLIGGTSPTPTRLWSDDRPQDVPGFLRGEQDVEEGEAIGEEGETVGEEGETVGEEARFVPRYVMAASVTPPRLVRQRTAAPGDYADYSGQLVRAPSSDRLRIVETTYLGDVNIAYSIDDLPGGQTVPLRGLPQYRKDIQATLPSGYAENIRPNTINLKVFTVQFRTEGAIAKIPLLGRTLQDLLDKNRDEIKREIDSLAERAGAAAKSAVEGKGLPLGDLAKELVEQAVKALGGSVFELLADKLGSTESPTWTLVHLVLYQPPGEPESVFRLVSSQAETFLYAIERDPTNDAAADLVEDIRGRPSYPLFKKEQVAFYRTGRRMRGVSVDPSRPVPGGPRTGPLVPASLWERVGAKGQAAEWASAEQNEGFHVLVPTLPAVLAIRADVRAREASLF